MQYLGKKMRSTNFYYHENDENFQRKGEKKERYCVGTDVDMGMG